MIRQRTVIYASTGGLPALPRLERIAHDTVTGTAYRHRLPRPGPAYAAVQITISGRGALWHPDGTVQQIPPGWAMCLLTDRSRFVYGVPDDALEPWEFLFIEMFGLSALDAVGELVARHTPVVRCDADHPVLDDLKRRLPTRGTRIAVMTPGESAMIAMAVIAGLVDQQRDPDPSGEHHLCLQTMEMLRSQLADPPSIATVARQLGVSREHLTRLFTASCGEPPARWLRTQRLAEADRRLRGGPEPIADIARACGFATASHFIHSFQQQYGRTPAEHRRRR
ncbi:MAG: helix-turn-helix domain-containing protein [Planctomycetes bacterium]|nr:helix-turn-helix domain-containing protein [Planctomycetota bacterium]